MLRRIIVIAFSLLLVFFIVTIGINGYVISSTRDDVHTIAQVEDVLQTLRNTNFSSGYICFCEW